MKNYFKQFMVIATTLLLLICCQATDSSDENKNDQDTPLDGRGGGYIAFQSERHGPKEALYIMNADGTAQTKLTENPGRNVCPALSPDSKKIAFSSDRTSDYEIYIIDFDGRKE